MKKTAIIPVLSAGVLWGLLGLFTRTLGARGLSSIDIVEVRAVVGCLMAGGYLLCFHRDQMRIHLRDLWCFFGAGVISMLFFAWCYFSAMNYTTIAVAVVLLYTSPAFVMLLSLILFRERLTGSKVAALVLALVGCALASGLGAGGAISPKGLLFGLGSGFFYALYSIFSRYAINRGYRAWTITFYSLLFCAVGGAFLCNWQAIGTVAESGGLPLIVSCGIATAFLPYLFYGMGLEHMESSRAAILVSIEPVVGTLISVFVFHETITLVGILGIVLVLSAIVVLSLPKKSGRNGHSL